MARQKKINSRSKGKRGELEVSKILTEAGFPARRGQQFQGTPDSPDIICPSLRDYHFEVKRTEAGNPYKWMSQALKDASKDQTPVIVHKRNDFAWLAILSFNDFVRILERLKRYEDIAV